MANTIYAGNQTLMHTDPAGVNIHIEAYRDEVLSRFEYNALFMGLTNQRTLDGDTNLYRMDRMGTSKVKARGVGEALDPQKVLNDKISFSVDTTLYIRNPIDYQTDWTSPDRLMEMARNNGYSFAEIYDMAHMIQLIKARKMAKETRLGGVIEGGIEQVLTVSVADLADPSRTQTDIEADAVTINLAHRKGIDALVKRGSPITDLVTLVHPDVYSALIEHPKLVNLETDTSNGGSYSDRRVVKLNGVPVIECTCWDDLMSSKYGGTFPLTSGANVDTAMQQAYTMTADDKLVRMVTFSKSKTLITLEAQPMTTNYWDDPKEFQHVLDAYTMYNVGIIRPDCVVGVKFAA